MGEAYDRMGQFLGSVEAETKREVLEKLQAQFGDRAEEIRIKTIHEGGVNAEMPRYKSHKVVHALKIVGVERDSEKARGEGRETDGSALLTPEDRTYAPFRVDRAFVQKHVPIAPFYYVVYSPDGYASLSPIQAFEEGYTRL